MRVAKALLVIACAALLTSAAQGQTRRPTPTPTPWPNEPPSVKLAASADRLVLASNCPEAAAAVPACRGTGTKVELRAQATDPDGDSLLYTYAASAGRVSGDGPEVTLDLTGVAPGVYDVSVEVDDGNGGIATDAAKITVARCVCDTPPQSPVLCPTVVVSCPDGGQLIYKANVTGGDPAVTPTFNWTASPGTITDGQGTSSITVNAQGMSYGVFTATVEVVGYDRSCRTSTSCTLVIEGPGRPRKVDEYGTVKFSQEKARLDNYVAELRNDPSARGYVICYGGRRGVAGAARRRCARARKHLIRGQEPSRIVTVDGGLREEPAVELWVVPSGASEPVASPTVEPPAPKRGPRTRAGRR